MSKITKEQLAEWISILDTRIQTINNRTKIHTLDIKKIEKQLKELENEKQKKSKKGFGRSYGYD